MNRRCLRQVARWIVGALLFTQLAVAAYACPDLFGVGADVDTPLDAVHVIAATDDDAARVIAPDEPATRVVSEIGDASNLCVEHCKSGQQIDHSISVAVPVAWPSALYVRKPTPPDTPARRADGAVLSALVATAPPHAILHCVRRT